MIRHLTTLSLLALVASCTTQNTDSPKPALDSSRNPDMLAPDLYPSGAVPEKEPVVRYGRYTLVSTQPDSGQRDLMAQIIDVSIPANMHPSVRDAMQYVVDRSGYSLCSPATGHVNILYTRPLPAAQYKLGPMTLRNTLQVLAGPAWQVKVDEVNRQVCYVLRPGYQLPDPPRPSTTLLAKQNTDQPVVPKHSSQTPASNDSGSAVTVATVPTPPSITTAPTPVTSSAPVIPAAKPVLPPVAAAKDGPSTPGIPTTVVPASASQKPPASPAPPTHVVTAAARPVPDNRERAPAPTPQPTYWTAAVGSTLHQTVLEWSKRADWQLIWVQEDLDYQIEAPLHFKGTFAEAIAQVFPLYDGAPRPFKVDGNPDQRIVSVSERKK